MNEQEAQELIDKYNNGTASPEERAWVDHWYIREASGKMLTQEQDFEHLDKEIWEGTLKRAGLSEKKAPSKIWYRITAAAAVLLFIAAGTYFYKTAEQPNALQKAKQYVQDIPAGGNKAVLTLANGEKVVLTDVGAGKIAEQAGINISKTADGQLIYSINPSIAENENAPVGYNTIETPKGGQYQVNLPDGTRVWLNASSSLKYPTRFVAKERRVELRGEGYFEVARDLGKPFRLMSNKQEVEVLGTHFNVNAYPDENGIRTTLLEGSVKVKESGHQAILKPGQQAVLKGNTIKVDEADTEMATAWKEGYFMFKNASLQTLMRQLSRWYDVEVIYAGDIPPTLFSGKVHRNTSLAQTLELLSFSKVNFKIEGKKMSILSPSAKKFK
ncbi:FecR family protein [Pedobacter caeni]|uniref:FecR family protein n=1 Tax=Pedobacter caeni TaxID=288992 RepID=A0A1M5AHV8_9SPHI|nr:FecR family protein [Pedobacter caeni]SHF29725.1 FecR family protein [Pedobacter caeni]